MSPLSSSSQRPSSYSFSSSSPSIASSTSKLMPSSLPSTRSMPPECLERIVFHASQDHRVLCTLMQVNSTLFQMATPYLYREAFHFQFGDEFILDWNTEAWTRHLREVRHTKLLLLYLSCTEPVQSALSPSLSLSSSSSSSSTPSSLSSSLSSSALSSAFLSPHTDLLNSTATLSAASGQTVGAKQEPPGPKSGAVSTKATAGACPTIQRNKYLRRLSMLQGQGQRQHEYVEPQDNDSVNNDDSRSHSLPMSSLFTGSAVSRIPASLETLLKTYIDCLESHSDTTNATMGSSISASMKRKPGNSCGSIGIRKGKQRGTSNKWTGQRQRTVNYLDYVEHLDLDIFLTTAIQNLFSLSSLSSCSSSKGKRRLSTGFLPSQHHGSSRSKSYLSERVFIEQVLFRSTAQHITTLSLSVTTFARLQRDLMEYIVTPSSSMATAAAAAAQRERTPKTKNGAGVWEGAPLSQLSRLNISGLHAELKPRVLRAIRWFLRRHVAVYPGTLTAISLEGAGDSIVNRRRQRNRNVVAAEPVQPGVVHFNHQDADYYDENEVIDELEEEEQPGHGHHNHHHHLYQHQQPQTTNHHQYPHHHPLHYHNLPLNGGPNGVLFVDAAGQINNILNGGNNAAAAAAAAAQAAVAFPGVFHSQYYLLNRNPDQSCEIDFLCVFQELQGQLKVLDLSQWSWSVITHQALDLIPTSHLTTLRFHPRTRIQSPHGSLFLSRCPMLKDLEIHAFDAGLLDLDNNSYYSAFMNTNGSSSEGGNDANVGVNTTTLSSIHQHQQQQEHQLMSPSMSISTPDLTSTSITGSSSSVTTSLQSLSLTGSVQNVLPAASDAIRIMGKSLTTLELTGHLDGFLSAQQTHRLMDWSVSLSDMALPHLTTLQLHGHLAMTFEVPLLLELCPTLRKLGLTIRSYTSTSFIRSEAARVLPRFMVPWEKKEKEMANSDPQSHGSVSKEARKFCLRELHLEGPWILTDKDMTQLGEQIYGLVVLNLVECRFYPNQRRRMVNEEDRVEEDLERCGDPEVGKSSHDIDSDQEQASPVVRLVERMQGTLRILRVHRRGLEGKPRRDSADYSSSILPSKVPATSSTSLDAFHDSNNNKSIINSGNLSTAHISLPSLPQSSSLPRESVLEFKKRFPLIELQIQERQHEHSFVLASSAETLRRIHQSPRPARIPTHFSDLLGQPSSPSRLHDFQAQNSAWRRVQHAMPFLKIFQRRPTYTPNGYENHLIRSWGRPSERFAWLLPTRRRSSVPNINVTF
ncbi:hypothetical protein BX616_007975 [Lobosporangium transversale]|uniref:Uncharacterized protein n=1 Tax=Lobosporangium transversale TaxID=64571 RepID=A0A1Y2GUM7_9FUNG|nr:hypothetical protein BCR41DRAFT_14100 [Lobosporangium transversale]KAF9914589.1 hypothetical protein BX616_007975 [Lobosporangium transversale]ORZ22745.1 hypothetical protein BCR41DRAFT_14100 [Lobosporangium transversale]|eukprot:XP_021883299.1 hypothetical protein BCR41DRAFT_14100 [Lobosporangium transversale]